MVEEVIIYIQRVLQMNDITEINLREYQSDQVAHLYDVRRGEREPLTQRDITVSVRLEYLKVMNGIVANVLKTK